MYTQTGVPVPELFKPNPHLCDAINHSIVQSEIEGGVYLHHLPLGASLEIETQNRLYEITNHGDCNVLISGHPEFCPEPTLVHVHGCTWGGSMLKHAFIGRGMRMEFKHPAYDCPIITSFIVEIRPIHHPCMVTTPAARV
jgi:hypothetical protein